MKIKGEITLPNNMKMCLDLNAMATFEEHLNGQSAFEYLASIGGDNAAQPRVTDLRALYFACLQRHQPEITMADAGDVFSDYPDVLEELMQAAMPSDVEVTSGNGKPATKRK